MDSLLLIEGTADMRHPTTRPFTCLRLAAAALFALAMLPAARATSACSTWTAATVASSEIGLPTSGAVITSVNPVAPSGTTPAYCKLLGSILPVDPAAPPIRFQINLPTPWNGKALQFGGGGFDGQLNTGLDNVPNAWPGSLTPLQRGYVTFGSDGGHAGSDPDARFAANDEALRNFTGEALKKLRDVAQQITARHYGRGPGKTYFAGGSTGGREALAVAQRYPRDYEGIIANYPALEFVGLILRANAYAQSLYGPAGFLPIGKITNVTNRVVAACDAQDGLVDGIVSNSDACRFDLAALRCPFNIDLGPLCLTDAQIRTLRRLSDEMPLSFPLANGLRSSAPYGLLHGSNVAEIVDVGLLPTLQDPPAIIVNSYIAAMQSAYLKYFVTRQPDFNSRDFDPVGGGTWQARLQQVSALHDATSIDLREFARRGGKILMMHGTADTVVPFSTSVRYVTRLREAYGEAAVRASLRFYAIPGMAHGDGRYTGAWKSLDMLEDWVERGQEPVNPISRNVANLLVQTRPLCEYPAYPRYVGGNVLDAASFVCATP